MNTGYVPPGTIKILAICSLLFTNATPTLTGDTLIWNNQDQLPGQLAGFTDGEIIWNSEVFETAFRVDAGVISHILLQPDKSAAASSEKFRVESQFGDVLFGDLVAIDQTELVLQSQRFGKVRLARDAVRELRQLSHNQVVYDGPRWLDDWRVLKVGRELSEWRTTDMGYLTTDKYGGEIFHDLPQLEQAEVNLAVSWNGKPGFQIDFSAAADLVGVRSKPKLSIKSWGSDIVAVAQSRVSTASFVPLTKLTKQQSELRLRIVWDNEAEQATIYSAGSKKLADVPVNKLGKQFGVLFKNRSDNLTVEQIRLSKWNGTNYSDDRPPGEAYIRLADGRLLPEEVGTVQPGSETLTSATGKEVAIADLAIAELQPQKENTFESARLRFADGTVISGDLKTIQDDKVTLDSEILREPVTGDATGLSGIRFYLERTHEFDFRLLSEGRQLSGNLKPAKDRGQLGWASVGCQQAAAFHPMKAYTIERRLTENAPQANLSAGEIIYLQDGSVLLGEVELMDKQKLKIATTYAGEVSVPFSDIRAVEMIQGSGRASFTDPGWKYSQDTEPDQRSPDHLAVSKTVSLRHEELHHAGKVTFSCQWDAGFIGLLTMQLGESGKHTTRCAFTGDKVSARCIVNAAPAVNLPSIPERRANISIEAKGTRISIWVNGILASSADTGRPVADTGIWIQTGSARNRTRTPAGTAEPRLTISRLRIGENASRLGAGFAAAEELAMLLKLPRAKRQKQPRHILCATNRDFLRGELVGLDRQQVRFASGYEEVSLPRDRVAAIVWLDAASQPLTDGSDTAPPTVREKDEQDNAGGPAPQGAGNLATELWLRDGSIFVVDAAIRMQGKQLETVHPSLANLTVPLDQLWKVERYQLLNKPPTRQVANWQLELTKDPLLVSGTDQGTESPLVGLDVRDLQLPMLGADTFSVSKHSGQVIMLDFWASWCAPCVKSLPKLQAIAESFPTENVRFVAINQGEAEFTIQAFLAHQDLKLDVALDTDGSIAQRFNVKTIPQTLIIGPQGKIQRVFFGTPASLYENLRGAIEGLMTPTD